MPDLAGARVLVIGGAGFIGSHIVDQLLGEPVRDIVVLDDFARGARRNLDEALKDPRVSLVEGSTASTPASRCSGPTTSSTGSTTSACAT